MKKTIVVLGMHRSATSLIARTLNSEVYMGSPKHFIPPSFDNKKGFYEDRRIVLLNDAILQKANGSWDNPPSRLALKQVAEECTLTVVINGEHKAISIPEAIKYQLDQLYTEAGELTLGIKDPRMCLLMDLYEPHMHNAQYIMSWRNPKDIAKSLETRSKQFGPKMPLTDWIKLVRTYNERAQEFITRNISYK
jgi:hypothetical protein